MKADSFQGFQNGASSDHAHRPPRLGQCMTLSAGWYKINMVRPPAPPVLIHALSSVSRHPVRSDSVLIVESRTNAVAWALCGNAFPTGGYREYPSLIKGGHASYQLDISNRQIRSTETKVNVLVALNHHGLELNMEELKPGGIVLHVTPGWKFPSIIGS